MSNNTVQKYERRIAELEDQLNCMHEDLAETAGALSKQIDELTERLVRESELREKAEVALSASNDASALRRDRQYLLSYLLNECVDYSRLLLPKGIDASGVDYDRITDVLSLLSDITDEDAKVDLRPFIKERKNRSESIEEFSAKSTSLSKRKSRPLIHSADVLLSSNQSSSLLACTKCNGANNQECACQKRQHDTRFSLLGSLTALGGVEIQNLPFIEGSERLLSSSEEFQHINLIQCLLSLHLRTDSIMSVTSNRLFDSLQWKVPQHLYKQLSFEFLMLRFAKRLLSLERFVSKKERESEEESEESESADERDSTRNALLSLCRAQLGISKTRVALMRKYLSTGLDNSDVRVALLGRECEGCEANIDSRCEECAKQISVLDSVCTSSFRMHLLCSVQPDQFGDVNLFSDFRLLNASLVYNSCLNAIQQLNAAARSLSIDTLRPCATHTIEHEQTDDDTLSFVYYSLTLLTRLYTYLNALCEGRQRRRASVSPRVDSLSSVLSVERMDDGELVSGVRLVYEHLHCFLIRVHEHLAEESPLCVRSVSDTFCSVDGSGLLSARARRMDSRRRSSALSLSPRSPSFKLSEQARCVTAAGGLSIPLTERTLSCIHETLVNACVDTDAEGGASVAVEECGELSAMLFDNVVCPILHRDYETHLAALLTRLTRTISSLSSNSVVVAQNLSTIASLLRTLPDVALPISSVLYSSLLSLHSEVSLLLSTPPLSHSDSESLASALGGDLRTGLISSQLGDDTDPDETVSAWKECLKVFVLLCPSLQMDRGAPSISLSLVITSVVFRHLGSLLEQARAISFDESFASSLNLMPDLEFSCDNEKNLTRVTGLEELHVDERIEGLSEVAKAMSLLSFAVFTELVKERLEPDSFMFETRIGLFCEQFDGRLRAYIAFFYAKVLATIVHNYVSSCVDELSAPTLRIYASYVKIREILRMSVEESMEDFVKKRGAKKSSKIKSKLSVSSKNRLNLPSLYFGDMIDTLMPDIGGDEGALSSAVHRYCEGLAPRLVEAVRASVRANASVNAQTKSEEYHWRALNPRLGHMHHGSAVSIVTLLVQVCPLIFQVRVSESAVNIAVDKTLESIHLAIEEYCRQTLEGVDESQLELLLPCSHYLRAANAPSTPRSADAATDTDDAEDAPTSRLASTPSSRVKRWGDKAKSRLSTVVKNAPASLHRRSSQGGGSDTAMLTDSGGANASNLTSTNPFLSPATSSTSKLHILSSAMPAAGAVRTFSAHFCSHRQGDACRCQETGLLCACHGRAASCDGCGDNRFSLPSLATLIVRANSLQFIDEHLDDVADALSDAAVAAKYSVVKRVYTSGDPRERVAKYSPTKANYQVSDSEESVEDSEEIREENRVAWRKLLSSLRDSLSLTLTRLQRAIGVLILLAPRVTEGVSVGERVSKVRDGDADGFKAKWKGRMKKVRSKGKDATLAGFGREREKRSEKEQEKVSVAAIERRRQHLERLNYEAPSEVVDDEEEDERLGTFTGDLRRILLDHLYTHIHPYSDSHTTNKHTHTHTHTHSYTAEVICAHEYVLPLLGDALSLVTQWSVHVELAHGVATWVLSCLCSVLRWVCIFGDRKLTKDETDRLSDDILAIREFFIAKDKESGVRTGLDDTHVDTIMKDLRNLVCVVYETDTSALLERLCVNASMDVMRVNIQSVRDDLPSPSPPFNALNIIGALLARRSGTDSLLTLLTLIDTYRHRRNDEKMKGRILHFASKCTEQCKILHSESFNALTVLQLVISEWRSWQEISFEEI